MKIENKYTAIFLKTVALLAISLMICALIPSCKGVEPTYIVEHVKHDTIKTVQIQRDSVHVRDSVYRHVYTSNDTVHDVITKWRTEYRDYILVDTAYISRVDSIPVVKEIVKPLTKWQSACMAFGKFSLFTVLAAACIFLWRVLK